MRGRWLVPGQNVNYRREVLSSGCWGRGEHAWSWHITSVINVKHFSNLNFYIYRAIRKGSRCGGIAKGVENHNELRAGRPCEGLSARLEADCMYRGEIHNEFVLRRSRMHCRTRFCSGLWECPPRMAWMTPWLSERMVKCVLWCPCEITRLL
jgi:hypothetical protein